jgi:macrolide transport system ATP-binding/permease protein
LLEIKGLIKYYGEKKILELESLALHYGDRLAVTGRNGSGKTTLLKMITGETELDAGRITVKGSVGVISQMDDEQEGEADSRIAGKLGLGCEAHSGGERVKERIAKAFSCPADILLADEPTTNLDMTGISSLEGMLLSFRGGLIIVSHDRTLLKAVCNKVLEIDKGECKLYSCGYEEYLAQKELDAVSDQARYERYIAERDRLKKAAAEKARRSAGVKKTPKRMGNSESRLHKMGGQGAKEKLDRSAKAALTRLEQLERVEKPWEHRAIRFDILPGAVHSPVLITVNDVSKQYEGRSVLEHCSFIVSNNKKTALIGDNGAGKTTLLNMIVLGGGGIEKCKSLKIGYFRQDMSGLDDTKSVLENALETSAYDQQFTRTILARLLFTSSDVNKKARVISGGERIKLALAKIILSDFNLLVLDEPTNYLDIESRKALEQVLAAYPGAVLFVSHDREFIRNVADRIVIVKDKTAVTFEDACLV